MKSYTIPKVQIEIGENLYLRIENVSFLPFKRGYTSGRPEDCYEDEPAECDWKDEDCKLVIKKRIPANGSYYADVMAGRKPEYKTVDFDFECDPSLAMEYYEQIIEAIEEMEK